MSKVLTFCPLVDLKYLRAQVIKSYIAPQTKVVCFTCGTASKALRSVGLDVISVGNHESLIPNKWFTQKEIQDTFNLFDATCGHLNMELMNALADEYKRALADYIESDAEYIVPTGSGETLVCLKLAFPEVNFHAVYNKDEYTEYHKDATLNRLVSQLATTISK